jgi:WD40 repeat protein
MQIHILAEVFLASFATTLMAQGPHRGPNTIKLPSQLTAVAISAASLRAVAVSQDKKLTLWDITNGRLLQTIPLHTASIDLVRLSDDGRWVFAGDHFGNYSVWEANTGKAQLRLQLPHYPSAAAFTRDNKWIAIAPMGDPVEVFDLGTAKKAYQTQQVAGGVMSVAFSRDGTLLATADADTFVRIYDARTGNLVAENRDFLLEPLAVDFTADGRKVVAGGGDRVVGFIDTASGKTIRRLQKMDEPVSYSALRVSPDGSFVAALLLKAENMTEPAPILVWDVSSGQEKSQWKPASLAYWVDWTQEGHLIAVGPDGDSLRIFRAP